VTGRAVAVMVGQTLRQRRMTLLGWSITLSLAVITYVALFPSVAKIDLDALLKQFPPAILQAFGFDATATQLNTAIGFLNTELFGFMLPLAIVFLPVGVIVRVISRAEENHYLDALLSAPLARWNLVASAAISATFSMLVPICAMVLVGLITAWAGGIDLTLSEIGGSALSLLPLGALAGGFALLVIGLTRRHGAATAVAVGVIVVMYLMNVLAGLISFFKDIEGLSLFHYYSDWINSGINWPQYLAVLVIAAALSALGAWLFERRDIS
jgi:ABC-2 type transport system permease protein